MSQPYIGEIRMFAGNFAPAGWAFCDGSVLPISEYETLFQLIGTTYGGDGQDTFAVPNLGGRIPLHQGTGPGGTTFQIGDVAGSELASLTTQQVPQHTHPIAAAASATTTTALGNVIAGWQDAPYSTSSVTPTTQLSPMLAQSGGSQPHENLQPYLAVAFIISLFGVFPSTT